MTPTKKVFPILYEARLWRKWANMDDVIRPCATEKEAYDYLNHLKYIAKAGDKITIKRSQEWDIKVLHRETIDKDGQFWAIRKPFEPIPTEPIGGSRPKERGEKPNEQVPKSKLRQQGDWVYAKVSDTEMRGRREPKGIEFEQVSPTYNREDLDKAVRIIEEFFGKKLPTAIPGSFELYNTQYSSKQLQEMAKDAKISPSGLKQDLINRLVQRGVLK